MRWSGDTIGAAEVIGGGDEADASARGDGAIDTEEFAKLFRAQSARVYRLVMRLGVAERDAEDICQEAFVTAYRSWGDFRGEARRGTWVCGIAVRLAANYRRLARVRHERFDTPEAAQSDAPGGRGVLDPEARLAERQRSDALHRLLDAIPEPRREVLVLYELEEMTMAEVTTLLGIPLQTGYSRLHAARKELHTALARMRGMEVL